MGGQDLSESMGWDEHWAHCTHRALPVWSWLVVTSSSTLSPSQALLSRSGGHLCKHLCSTCLLMVSHSPWPRPANIDVWR